MIKLVLLIGFAAGGLYWLASQAPSTPSQELPAEGSLAAPAPTKTQLLAISNRRAIFCSMVEEVKRELRTDASQREKNLFDLAPNSKRWEVLRSYMTERGSPDGKALLETLAVQSFDDIEFGTLDGTIPCAVPEEVGYVIRRSPR
jgi:hypothetical protein